MLTNTSLEHFNKWLQDNDHTPWIIFFEGLPDTVKLAYHIEWLDSVGIYATIIYHHHLKQFTEELCGYLRTDFEVYKTRTQAMKAAIEKANDFYNSKATDESKI